MKSKKIMVVEDEKLTMLFISETLEDYGYEDILEYVAGQELIDEIKGGIRPDLILMDINIKGAKDGIQTAKEVLKICNIPIIFMSAYNDKETISEVLSVSLYGFISKPFNEQELYIALEFAWKNFAQNNIKEEVRIKSKLKLYDNCIYDLETQSIYLHDKLVTLPYNQKVLLDTLAKDANVIVDKEQLSYSIWESKEESKSALRTVVYLLRKSLDGLQISSQSKYGYVLKASYL